MSDSHSRFRHQADELPLHIKATRKKLSKLKKDDFRDGYGAYCGLVRTYKVDLTEYSSRSEANLSFALNMAVDDVYGVPHFRVPLAAASLEVGLNLGLMALEQNPKLVLKAFAQLESGSNKETRYLADTTSNNNTKKQIKKAIKLAKGMIKRAAKSGQKAPLPPNRERSAVQSGGRAQATSAQPTHR